MVNTKALVNPTVLVDEVNRILTLNQNIARALIGKTSITAYRRVHEIVASALDRVPVRATPQAVNLNEILTDLTKSLILIKYQRARDQLSNDLADNLETIVREVINNLRTGSNIQNTVVSARTLIDAFAVLVYMYGK